MSAKVMGMSRDGCGLDENHRAELGQGKTQTGLRVKLMSEVRMGVCQNLSQTRLSLREARWVSGRKCEGVL